ncbi:serine/threonine-protein kinase [Spirillospora sp. NPDC052269]
MTSVEAEPPRIPGERLGPYRIARVLGRGGMGTVYLAEAPDGRRVAIKVLHPSAARAADFRERFRREVTAALQVRPFCTAPVLDASFDGEPLYVVTEYVQGPTLEDVILRHGPRRGSDLEGLAAGVATALAAIHGAGVVHRDLKPANILLSPFGPRVIDFGIARTLGVDLPMTQANLTMGTPSFMAPEGLAGEPITTAADVFSWGCVIAFAGTGRLPFDGGTVAEMLYRTVHGTPDLDGLAPPRLRDLVERATRRDPARRPTATELLEELIGVPDPERAAAHLPGRPPAEPDPGRPAEPDPGRPAEARPGDPNEARPGRPNETPPSRDGATRLLGSEPEGAPAARPAPRRKGRGALLGVTALAVGAAIAGGAWALWPSGAKPLVDQGFAGSPSAAWPAASGNGFSRSYKDGGLVVRVFTPSSWHSFGAPLASPRPHLVVDASVRVRSAAPDDEAGVFCRTGGQTQYEVLLARSGQVRVRKGDGVTAWQLARSSAPAGTPGGTVNLRAKCDVRPDGVRVTARVDGKEVVSASDRTTPPPGFTTGILAGRERRPPGSSATDATFRRFQATADG